MTGLASSASHIFFASSRASDAVRASISSVMYLPTLTPETFLKPRLWSELSTARPCGSRIPLRGVTNTLTCNSLPLARVVQPLVFHPPQHLVICLFDAAQVTAEAILVEFLPRRLVPEAASVGTNLIAKQNLAVMAPELKLEIDEDHAALVQEFCE